MFCLVVSAFPCCFVVAMVFCIVARVFLVYFGGCQKNNVMCFATIQCCVYCYAVARVFCFFAKALLCYCSY